MQSHYDILKITKDATPKDIVTAYRSEALAYHPDRNHSEEATAVFQAINAAFKVLSDENQRKLYDREIVQKTKGMAFSVMSEGSSSSGTALTVQKNYNFSQIILSANLSASDRLKLAKESEDAALIFASESDLQNGWKKEDLRDLALLYEKVALCLFHNDDPIYYSVEESFVLLEKYKSVVQLCLGTTGYTALLNGKRVDALIKIYGNFFESDWHIEYKQELMWRLASFKHSQIASEAKSASSSSAVSANSTTVATPSNSSSASSAPSKDLLASEFKLFTKLQLLEEKNITRFRDFFKKSNKETFHKWVTEYLRFAEAALEDEILRQNFDYFNGRMLYDLAQKHGEVIKSAFLNHEVIKTKYIAFETLLNYIKSGCQDSIVDLFSITGLRRDDMFSVVQAFPLFAELYIEKYTEFPFHFHSKAVYCAAFHHDDLALKIYSSPELVPVFRNIVMNSRNMRINSAKKCILVLTTPQLNKNLSGQDLHDFVVLLGEEISDHIFSDESLSQRLMAYRVLDKAKKQGKLNLAEKTTLPLGEDDKADFLYQAGLGYLKTQKTAKMAAEYFRRAATLGHEAALQELVLLMPQLDKKYLHITGELYLNRSHDFFDKEKAEYWLFKAIEHGVVKAIYTLLEILEDQVSNNELDMPVSEHPIFICATQAIFEWESELALHERNTLWHKLLKICFHSDAKQEAIYISQFISNKNAEDLSALGHLQLEYLADVSRKEIETAHPDWSDDEVRLEMLKPEFSALRLNAAIPYFIQAMNLYADFGMDTLVHLLRDLANTHLTNAEVCSLVLKNKELVGHPHFPADELFLMCRANPMVIRHHDTAFIVVQHIKNPEQLYSLGWECLRYSNKITASVYLLWFRASQYRHVEATLLVDYLALPCKMDEKSLLLKTLDIHLDANNEGGLDDDMVGFDHPQNFKEIVGTLIFSLNQPESFSFNSTPAHLCAKVDDLNQLPESQWKLLDRLDHHNQSPLQVLFEGHGEAAVLKWQLLFQENKDLMDVFYLALLNTRGEVSDAYRILQQQLIAALFNNMQVHNNTILLRSLHCLTKARDLDGVNFLMRWLDPAIAIGVINALLKNIFHASQPNLLFSPRTDNLLKASLHAHRRAIIEHWGKCIGDLSAYVRMHINQPIFFDNGYEARMKLQASLRSIKLWAYKDESNGLIDLQVTLYLTTFMNALLKHQHQKPLAMICAYLNMPTICQPVAVEDVKDKIVDRFRESFLANRVRVDNRFSLSS